MWDSKAFMQSDTYTGRDLLPVRKFAGWTKDTNRGEARKPLGNLAIRSVTSSLFLLITPRIRSRSMNLEGQEP